MNEPRLPVGFDPLAYEEEARGRWEGTEAYRQSQQRTADYGEREWAAAIAEGERIADRFAVVKRSGADAGSPDGLAAAEAHREHIARRFYDCSAAMHVALGEMYVTDLRFAAYWNACEEGLAAFVRAAIAANAGSDSASR